MAEIEVMIAEALPSISTAIGAYGAGVLTRAEDAGASATVELGRRMLQWIWRRAGKPAALEEAVTDFAGAPTDEDALAALRLQLRKLLTQDESLRLELSELLPERTVVNQAGDRSVYVGRDNTGIISTGDNATNDQR